MNNICHCLYPLSKRQGVDGLRNEVRFGRHFFSKTKRARIKDVKRIYCNSPFTIPKHLHLHVCMYVCCKTSSLSLTSTYRTHMHSTVTNSLFLFLFAGPRQNKQKCSSQSWLFPTSFVFPKAYRSAQHKS